MLRLLCLLICVIYSTQGLADKFEQGANYKVCFTPSQNCGELIVGVISKAKQEILVQAYSFTSVPIAKALIEAHKKGIKVRVILDKSQFRNRGFSSAKLLSDYHIPVFIDYKVSIAHNKVMIIDKSTIITGSFNFTRSAQERNAENVIIINDSELAKKYAKNWQQRLEQSKELLMGFSPFFD